MRIYLPPVSTDLILFGIHTINNCARTGRTGTRSLVIFGDNWSPFTFGNTSIGLETISVIAKEVVQTGNTADGEYQGPGGLAQIIVLSNRTQDGRLPAVGPFDDISKKLLADMPKASGLPHLNLASNNKEDTNGLTPATLSPRSTGSPHTPRSAPTSPFLQGPPPPFMSHSSSAPQDDARTDPSSPKITAIPELPPSPVPQSPKHARDPSKGFFSNLMASKSSHKLHQSETNIPEAAEKASTRSRASSKDRTLHTVKKQGSTPDLPKSVPNNGMTSSSNPPIVAESAILQPPLEPLAAGKKPKPRFGGILARKNTVRMEESTPKSKAPPPSHLQLDMANISVDKLDETSPKTAPIKFDHRDRAFADTGATVRNRSADRHARDDFPSARRERQAASITPSHSFREGSTLQILSNIGHTGKGVGDRIGKAGKGFFGKITRSGSSNERETPTVTDDNYTCTTINMSLVKQTRKTRIARRLEVSKDKTEFWMPALPWRCIE